MWKYALRCTSGCTVSYISKAEVLVQHRCTCHSTRYIRLKYSGFLLGGSQHKLKGASNCVSPEAMLLRAPVYLTGPASHLYWLGSVYPIICCRLIS